MKTTLGALLTLALLTGCATGGGSWMDPEVVSGNERYVVVYDVFGLPGKAQATAESYCRRYGRIAQFQGMGGDSYQCTRINYCSRYACVL